MQVHKLDMINNFTRDCAAAESHVLEENSQANIVNIGLEPESSTMAVVCDSGRKKRQ